MKWKWRKNREMKRLVIAGADVWTKWFYSERHLPGTDKELADVAREVLPLLGRMADVAVRRGWIESDPMTESRIGGGK